MPRYFCNTASSAALAANGWPNFVKKSAVQEVRQQFGLPVVPIASLADLLALLQDDAQFRQYLEPVQAYRDRYGVAG